MWCVFYKEKRKQVDESEWAQKDLNVRIHVDFNFRTTHSPFYFIFRVPNVWQCLEGGQIF